MTEKRKAPKGEQNDIYEFRSVASASDYTGLTPSLPVSAEEMEAYEQIYNAPVPGGVDNCIKKNRQERQS